MNRYLVLGLFLGLFEASASGANRVLEIPKLPMLPMYSMSLTHQGISRTTLDAAGLRRTLDTHKEHLDAIERQVDRFRKGDLTNVESRVEVGHIASQVESELRNLRRTWSMLLENSRAASVSSLEQLKFKDAWGVIRNGENKGNPAGSNASSEMSQDPKVTEILGIVKEYRPLVFHRKFPQTAFTDQFFWADQVHSMGVLTERYIALFHDYGIELSDLKKQAEELKKQALEVVSAWLTRRGHLARWQIRPMHVLTWSSDLSPIKGYLGELFPSLEKLRNTIRVMNPANTGRLVAKLNRIASTYRLRVANPAAYNARKTPGSSKSPRERLLDDSAIAIATYMEQLSKMSELSTATLDLESIRAWLSRRDANVRGLPFGSLSEMPDIIEIRRLLHQAPLTPMVSKTTREKRHAHARPSRS